jgi:hypothetical protein
MYGSSGNSLSFNAQRTPIVNPLIFLEDDDCSKCKVLQSLLDAATEKLHAANEYLKEAREPLSPPREQSNSGSAQVRPCRQCVQLRREVLELSALVQSLRGEMANTGVSLTPWYTRDSSATFLRAESSQTPVKGVNLISAKGASTPQFPPPQVGSVLQALRRQHAKLVH